jgi:hypothetical protein
MKPRGLMLRGRIYHSKMGSICNLNSCRFEVIIWINV